jgi:hypothetical protein
MKADGSRWIGNVKLESRKYAEQQKPGEGNNGRYRLEVINP